MTDGYGPTMRVGLRHAAPLAPGQPEASWRGGRADIGAAGAMLAESPWGVVLLLLAFTALSMMTLSHSGSADYRALWLAGDAVASGRPDLVYPAVGRVFAMQVPPEWVGRMAAQGYTDNVYPFIYPPLWAFVMAKVNAVLPLGLQLAMVSLVNPLLVGIGLVLAHRVAAPGMNRLAFVAAGLALLYVSAMGSMALYQNQPEILVATLTVLAIERSERGRGPGAQWTAGAVLALAAALKLFPAFLALVWLMQGRRRALAGFALAGAALGGLSLAVAGWPLHAEFLALTRVISDTTMLTDVNYNLAATIAQVGFPHSLHFVVNSAADPGRAGAGWFVALLPQALMWGLKLAMLAVLLGGGWWLRRATDSARAAIWPAVILFAHLFGPLAWSYHYLAAALFMPMLLERFGLRRGALLAAVALATDSGLGIALRSVGPLILFSQIMGVAGVVLLGAAFVLAAGRPGSRPAPAAVRC